jgi:hypothetical protein
MPDFVGGCQKLEESGRKPVMGVCEDSDPEAVAVSEGHEE